MKMASVEESILVYNYRPRKLTVNTRGTTISAMLRHTLSCIVVYRDRH